MHPEVVAAIMPFIQNPTGNPSSLHSYGRMARSAIESARGQVAALLNCNSDAIIFTSSGTEANNMLLKGYVDRQSSRPVVSSLIEHPSVLAPLQQLEDQGQSIIRLPANRDGQVDLEPSRKLLSNADPQLMTIMYANNETGVIQPLAELAASVDRERCLLHSDATQAVGKLPLDLAAIDIDAISFSGHKLRGPQGIGALVINRKPRQVLISGGEQENWQRAGTENVAMIVGLGKAAEVARLEMEQRRHHVEELRNAFEDRLSDIPGSVVFGQKVPRLPNTTYFALPYYHGETLLMELDRAGFAVSSGSACHSAVTEPSHVLKAMGVDDQLALNAIRVSFGLDNTLQEVEQLIAKLQQLVEKLPAVMRPAAMA